MKMVNFLDMRTTCPKIFAKLDFFATMSQMGVKFFYTENILSISDISANLPCLPSS